MGISLSKGQGISLTKANNGNALSQVTMGLGWDAYVWDEEKTGGFMGGLFGGGKSTGKRVKVERDVDLDASCLVIDKDGRVIDTIYFGNLTGAAGAIKHTGDNLTGDGDGDDEQIKVNLNSLSPDVKHVVFTVNAFSNVNFDIVHNAFCRLLDEKGKEVIRFPLDSSGNHTAIVMAKVTRNGNDWDFDAIGEKCNGRTVKAITDVVKELLR